MFFENNKISIKQGHIVVVSTALGVFKIVANMYSHFSENTFGITVECFNRLNQCKFSTSSIFSYLFNSKIYPPGNLSGLFATALFIALVSTPYSSARLFWETLIYGYVGH